MVPSRDSLFMTGSEDEAGLAILAAIADKPLREPYALSGVPLIFEDGFRGHNTWYVSMCCE